MFEDTYVSMGADLDFLILFPAAAAALSAVSSASPSTTQLPSLTIQFSVHSASVNSAEDNTKKNEKLEGEWMRVGEVMCYDRPW